MNAYVAFIVILIAIFVINHFLHKVSFVKDRKKNLTHKSFIDSKSKPPFSGGILFLISLIIFLPNDHYLLKIFCFIIFLIGFFSDIEMFKSPNFRFLAQLIFITIFVILSQTFITSTKIDFIDLFLGNFLFKVFFVTFCLLILINGTNFIDGVNTLVIGYYLLILLFLQNIYTNLDDQTFSVGILNFLIFSLIALFILNFFNLLYLGDNGAYLVSFIIGVLLINLAEKYTSVSPYYIVNLLWYPAFENLFSILRKLKNKSSAFQPDNLHLHQLIFLYLKKNIKNNKIINTFTGCIINLYNFFVFYLATLDYSNTKYQLLLIFMSLLIYNILYITLKNKTIKR